MNHFKQERELEVIEFVNFIEAVQEILFSNFYPRFPALKKSVQRLKYLDTVMSSA
jgi:hypothetical protein